MDILIVGMGKLGYKLAETLAGPEHNVTVVDVDEQALARAVNRLDVLPVTGNGAQLQLLESLGVKKKDLVVAVTSSDETNVLICLAAKKLGCPWLLPGCAILSTPGRSSSSKSSCCWTSSPIPSWTRPMMWPGTCSGAIALT